MEKNQAWTMLSFKSAFIFFIMTMIINLIFQPLLRMFEMPERMNLFVVNSLGIGAALSYALLVLNKMYRNKKQAIILSCLITIASILVCYAVIFLG